MGRERTWQRIDILLYSSRPDANLRCLRILLAEDNAADAYLIEESLRRAGLDYVLDVFAHGDDAMRHRTSGHHFHAFLRCRRMFNAHLPLELPNIAQAVRPPPVPRDRCDGERVNGEVCAGVFQRLLTLVSSGTHYPAAHPAWNGATEDSGWSAN